jgi:hypothetical protein
MVPSRVVARWEASSGGDPPTKPARAIECVHEARWGEKNPKVVSLCIRRPVVSTLPEPLTGLDRHNSPPFFVASKMTPVPDDPPSNGGLLLQFHETLDQSMSKKKKKSRNSSRLGPLRASSAVPAQRLGFHREPTKHTIDSPKQNAEQYTRSRARARPARPLHTHRRWFFL